MYVELDIEQQTMKRFLLGPSEKLKSSFVLFSFSKIMDVNREDIFHYRNIAQNATYVDTPDGLFSNQKPKFYSRTLEKKCILPLLRSILQNFISAFRINFGPHILDEVPSLKSYVYKWIKVLRTTILDLRYFKKLFKVIIMHKL
jgi:hypothetical protein